LSATIQQAWSLAAKLAHAAKKITHLKVTYNAGTDLYDVQAWKMSKKTFEMAPVVDLPGVDCDQLKEICERACDLFFTIN